MGATGQLRPGPASCGSPWLTHPRSRTPRVPSPTLQCMQEERVNLLSSWGSRQFKPATKARLPTHMSPLVSWGGMGTVHTAPRTDTTAP